MDEEVRNINYSWKLNKLINFLILRISDKDISEKFEIYLIQRFKLFVVTTYGTTFSYKTKGTFLVTCDE